MTNMYKDFQIKALLIPGVWTCIMQEHERRRASNMPWRNYRIQTERRIHIADGENNMDQDLEELELLQRMSSLKHSKDAIIAKIPCGGRVPMWLVLLSYLILTKKLYMIRTTMSPFMTTLLKMPFPHFHPLLLLVQFIFLRDTFIIETYLIY